MATFTADPAILAEPPITQSEIIEVFGVDGRVCRGTVLRHYSSPQYIEMPGHPDDNHYDRILLWEEVVAFPICVEEASRDEWKAARQAIVDKGHSVRHAADVSRSAVAVEQESALAVLAHKSGLTVEQTNALLGRRVEKQSVKSGRANGLAR
jgi:hypothetical protein